MSITVVELFHRMGRRTRTNDFTRLSMSEQTDLAEAANAALQRLYNALPAIFKEQTQGFVLPAPFAITGVGVTQYGKVTTGTPFTAAQFGQTVVLDGDAAWNQIIGLNELLNPYMGATGTVAGTVYGNALFTTDYPLDRIIGDVKFADQPSWPAIYRATPTPVDQSWQWLYAHGVGRPQIWWPQVFGNSQGNTPMMALRFAPAPSQAFAVNVRMTFWPRRITLADYTAATALPVPEQFIDASLIPMALQELMSTPIWKVSANDDWVDTKGLRGEMFARNQIATIATPSNRVFTPAGY